MANLIWTGILYFSTLSVVYIVYKTFVNDRKYENELRVINQIRVAQGLGHTSADAVEAVVAAAELGDAGPTSVRRFTAPPRIARSTTIPANIRRA
jgi:homoserine kinase